MKSDLRIWHYGLMARWWAEFNHGGEDVEFFRRAILACGEPALDAGCGTGRLLVPLLADGLDVDGSDASADMLELCGKLAKSKGLSARLYSQAMHELALPRRYRTIVVCGAFGLGGTRAHDLEGLKRIHAHLEPGGSLVMDHHSLPPGAQDVRDTGIVGPQEWPEQGDRRRTQDGSELEMRIRLLRFDPVERIATRETRIRLYESGEEVSRETFSIDICVYNREEIESMLETAGFETIRVTGGLEDRPVAPDTDARMVFHASP